MRKTALTIAGYDPCAGAGIIADIKTFHAFGVYGTGVITANTIQNTERVFSVDPVSPQIVSGQIYRLFDDMEIEAVKIGMLGNEAVVEAVITALKKVKAKNIILDPIVMSSSGHRLISEEGQQLMVNELFPMLKLVTPNLNEASVLAETSVKTLEDMTVAAQNIASYGVENILIKGGHLNGQAVDLLNCGGQLSWFEQQRIANKDTHGTGCALSSAIAAGLAKGISLQQSVMDAKHFITRMIQKEFYPGKGAGMMDHLGTCLEQ